MVKIGDKLMLPMAEDASLPVGKDNKKISKNQSCEVIWIHPEYRFCRVAFTVGSKKLIQAFHIQEGVVVPK